MFETDVKQWDQTSAAPHMKRQTTFTQQSPPPPTHKQWGHHAVTSTTLTCEKRVNLDTIQRRTSLASHWNACWKPIHNTILSLSHSISLFSLCDWAILGLFSSSGSLRAYFKTILDGTPNMWSVDQYTPTPFMPKPLYSRSQRVNSTSSQNSVLRNTGLELSIKNCVWWLF